MPTQCDNPWRIDVRNCETRLTAGFLFALAMSATPALAQDPAAPGAQGAAGGPFTRDFMLEACDFSSQGANPYFSLEPGYRLVLEGRDEGQDVVLAITVTDRTRRINDVETRVVVERESKDGELFEVAKNYFAICKQTNSVVYFGEDVDFYENGKIVSHEGSWRADIGDAKPGLIMPGTILLGARYFQELAPRIALDRAEVLSLEATIKTPFASFEHVLRTEETTLLEPGLKEFKFYAPGVGLIKDGPLLLVQAGFTAGDVE